MKPKRLKIKGLNSFIETQDIEFDRLTEKGLFGIFGPTGSGKSTILDAITIALYGKIARDSSEFINTECDTLSISYEFEIGDGNSRCFYVVDRNIKRDKNGKYKTTLARLMDSNEILAEGSREVQGKIEMLIGLTCDDFTRSVVLPQGKFSEFLKLTGRERRDMLERIFSLEKYGKGLGDKIKKVKNSKLKEMDILSGELKRYDNLSEESYEEAVKQFNVLTAEQRLLKSKKDDLDKQYESYKSIWELQQELKQYEDKEIELKQQLSDIEQCKLTLKKAQAAEKVKPFIEDVKGIEAKIKENEENIKNTITQLNLSKEKLAAIETSYMEALNNKEKLVPELIKKEAELLQAIEIQKKIKALEEDRDKLAEEYKGIHEKLKELLTLINNTSELREKDAVLLEELEKKIVASAVEPEYREKVQKAAIKEEEYNNSSEQLKDKEQKIKLKLESIASLEALHKKALSLQAAKEKEIKDIELFKGNLEKNCPGDNALLLKMQNDILSFREKLSEAEKNYEKNIELKEKLNLVLEKKSLVQKQFEDTSRQLDGKQKRLQDLRLKLEEHQRNNIASSLSSALEEGSPCPVCGSTHHPNLAVQVEEANIKKLAEDIDTLINEVDRLQKENKQWEIELAAVLPQENQFTEEISSVIERIKDINIEELRSEKIVKEQLFNDIKASIEKWNMEVKSCEEKLSALKDEKSKLDRDEIKYNEALNSDKAVVAELNNEYNNLKIKFEALSSEYEKLNGELKLDNIKQKLQELRTLEIEGKKLQQREKETRQKLSTYDKQKESYTLEKSKLDIKLAEILNSGKEKRASIDLHKEEIKKLSNDKEPISYLSEVREQIVKLNELEANIKKQLEVEKEKVKQLQEKNISEKQEELTLKQLYKDQSEKLAISLKESSFENIEEALDNMLDKQSMESLDKKISDYGESYNKVKLQIQSIKDKLQGKTVDQEQWDKLKLERTAAAEALDEMLKEIAKCQQIIEVMKSELQKLKGLLDKKKELEHISSLLDDLDKLVQGNKFVEFVALNQLRYITMEASKRLKDITRGRYALELDSDGNFTMRDDFNGGVVRPTNTLSGGETFLTSLALALSLSSQIQLKGSAPLEFFFLDEGFGTLDNELLEIVMSSLERLHSDRLSVGIISHVEELKSRVPVKLIVEPAAPGQGGSKIRIDYT
ncbi:AAA family ATPase [Clostridium omnivorum]|uniref:Nuclease SbcCD subunit C n=1 Tax=Clostridium omnivorum TaxID=1604902 RepID=A0ABQ5N882_9CLOT|nr:SbcC/MukB-like Walker B domain-containing protein [Clostridium sp. E14]GLC31341.1 nuclease SbcCD subunit C [Clostridium sp. E14]